MKFCLKALGLCGAVLFGGAGLSGAALVAHWGFEEGSGGVAGRTGSAGAVNDSINGTIATDYTWNGFGAPNTGGSDSINFKGANGRVVSSYLGIGGSGTRTVAFWMRTSVGNTDQAFVSWGDSADNGEKWHVRMNDNAGNGDLSAVRTEIQGSFEIGSTALNDGAWHHVVSVYSAGGAFGSGQVSHYIDGVLVTNSGDGSDSVAVDTVLVGDAAASANTTPVWIGARRQTANVDSFTGDIDEVRIYDHALTQVEIDALVVPEPSMAMLLGLTGLAVVLRRRK